MNERFPLLKFGAFALVCLAFTGLLVVVIGNISFTPRTAYAAAFSDVQGLLVNDDVKIAGVTLGRVERIEHRPGGEVEVGFTLNDDVRVPEDSVVSIRWRNVTGLRYLYVEPGEGEPAGAEHTFPRDQTRSPADLGSLLQRLTPFIDALDPAQQNQILEALSTALVGREQEIQDLIRQGGELTQSIASRDQEIERLLNNSVTVLDAYAAREQQLRGLIDSFAEVSQTLRERNDELDSAIVAIADGQEELRRLVDANDDEIRLTLDALERVTTVLTDQADDFERTLASSPRGLVGYHLISRTGQWFNIRAVGTSVGGQVVTTERGATKPRADGGSDGGGVSTDALAELFGGGVG
ncbi:MCE family protein [Nitriliruptor alkaliphilus]|uniref:MCE family protein n=1 Tax=Nitriliruptor alkaliphilus TaxID=427918 RepID=UPI0006977AB0|nr:MCE family protein [Nitriliruptor alkaliphilus]